MANSWFRVEGRVDGEVVTGTWSRGLLCCDPALLTRARIVVGLGDSFELGSQGPLFASLDNGPLLALLTLVRACDEVTAVELSEAVARDPAPPALRR